MRWEEREDARTQLRAAAGDGNLRKSLKFVANYLKCVRQTACRRSSNNTPVTKAYSRRQSDWLLQASKGGGGDREYGIEFISTSGTRRVDCYGKLVSSGNVG